MGATLNAEIEKRVAGSIIVNDRGERFQNEAADYDTTWRSYYTWENWGDTRYRNIPAFLIFDGSVREKRPDRRCVGDRSPARLGLRGAEPLRELATRLGVDPDGLEATVARFNAHARQGLDPDFPRGKSHYDRYGQPDVGITLAPIDERALLRRGGRARGSRDLRRRPGRRRARVLDPFGEVIPGLSASGNVAGVGSPGASYGGGGGTIGPALTFAYIAGRELAARSAT